MRQIGKTGKAWNAARRKWIKDNPPNHEGYYVCGICKRWVHQSEVTIDHILPRSKRKDLLTDPTNLQPAHYLCNEKKGSKVYGTDPWTKTSQAVKEA